MNLYTQKRKRIRSSPALLISLAVHLLLAVYAAIYVARSYGLADQSALDVEVWPAEVDAPMRRLSFEKPPPPRQTEPREPMKAKESPSAPTPTPIITPPTPNATAHLAGAQIKAPSELDMAPQLSTSADLPSAPSALGPGAADPRIVSPLRSSAPGLSPVPSQARSPQGSLENLRGNTLQNVENIHPSALTQIIPDDQLGAVLMGEGQNLAGYIRLIRVKHSLSDWWQDPTAMSSLIEWLEKNTKLQADMRYEGGALKLDDDRILDAPLIIMTGHDKDITAGRQLARGGPLVPELSDEERSNLRAYLIDRKGTLFFDDCGFNGVFAAQIQRELKEAMPEHDLVDLPHTHELYTGLLRAWPVRRTAGMCIGAPKTRRRPPSSATTKRS